MATAIIVFFLILALVAFAWLAWMILRFFWRLLFGAPSTRVSHHQVTITGGETSSGSGDMTGEEEGNVHSGPYGYSPNTPYPETQYGSLFDPDAEWNEERE